MSSQEKTTQVESFHTEDLQDAISKLLFLILALVVIKALDLATYLELIFNKYTEFSFNFRLLMEYSVIYLILLGSAYILAITLFVVATNKLSKHAPPNQKGWYIVSYVFFILSEIISYIAGSLLFYFNDLFPSQVDFSGILINLFYVLGIFASILSPISLFILSFKMNQHKDYFGWNFKPVYTSYLYLVFSIINGIFGGLNSYLWQNYLLGFILNFSYIALILAFYFEFYIRCKNIYKDEDDLLVELET